MAKVLISAGHTQMDPGDIFGDLKEAELTRKIANKVIYELKKLGIEVLPVPLDLPLLQRIDWINNTGTSEANGDICIEFHINSGGKRGFEAWFKGEGHNRSEDLAKHLLEYIEKELGYQKQGVNSEYKHELGSLTFLNRTNPTSIIIECFYIDNPEDNAILKNDAKLDELAIKFAEAIKEFISKPINIKQSMASVNPINTTNPASNPMSNDFGIGGPPGSFGGASNWKPPVSSTIPNTYSSTPSTMNPSPMGGTGNLMQDREARKEMIQKKYVQILGREPSQSDLNYFLNIGITEDQLTKRMIDSQEHVEIVKAKQELTKLKEEHEKLKNELTLFRSKASENEELLKNLNHLLEEKNKQITSLQQKLTASGIVNPN